MLAQVTRDRKEFAYLITHGFEARQQLLCLGCLSSTLPLFSSLPKIARTIREVTCEVKAKRDQFIAESEIGKTLPRPPRIQISLCEFFVFTSPFFAGIQEEGGLQLWSFK